MRDRYLYIAACKQAEDYIDGVCNDPMSRHYGAPMDDIIDSWLKTHIKACEVCREATFEANMP